MSVSGSKQEWITVDRFDGGTVPDTLSTHVGMAAVTEMTAVTERLVMRSVCLCAHHVGTRYMRTNEETVAPEG